ncbi:Leucine Rich Repeat family protein [Trichuris trichiura]|uniref:Leucine Rich Repeat family protein n=1 Tax=Trichuris trichiura TaxID=36087 RepID=A0A077ZHU9_TRITR|nr:Leucine Rich Repeat family protein [Trichuris trichiura]
MSTVHDARSTEELLAQLDLYLTAGIGEQVMRELQQSPEVLSVEMERYDLLMNHRRLPLVTMNLSGTQLCDTCLAGLLMEHASTLTCLNIANCARLSGKVHSLITRNIKLENMKFLDLSGLARIFSHILFKTKHDNVRIPVVSLSDALVSLMPSQSRQLADMQKREGAITNLEDMTWSGIDSDESGSSASPGSSASNFKMLTAAMTNLQAMIFRADIGGNEPAVESVGKLFTELLGPTSNLRYLDLSGWRHLGYMHYIEPLHNLTTLVLNDVQHLDLAIDAICSVKSLMHLDLSQHNRISGEFSRPVITLDRLVCSLPLLTALDISGTNLASSPSNDDWLEFNNAFEHSRSMQEPIQACMFCSNISDLFLVTGPS